MWEYPHIKTNRDETVVKTKKEYDTKLDSKNRLTVREASHRYFHVSVFDDGTILLKPRILVDPETISKNALKMIDKSINNFKNKKVSKKIDIEKYLSLLDN